MQVSDDLCMIGLLIKTILWTPVSTKWWNR